jgi:thermitase
LQVAPEAKILPLRVLNGKGKGSISKIAQAIDEAIYQGADVINMSLGTTSNSRTLETMIDYAESMGIYVVASAGNEGSTTILRPASFAVASDYVISVGSINSAGCRSSFSNYSSALNVSAPGEQVYTAFPDGKIGHATGTSFAAPIVSGMLALGHSNSDALEQYQLKGLLKSSASAFTPKNCTGSSSGKVTVKGLLEAVLN